MSMYTELEGGRERERGPLFGH